MRQVLSLSLPATEVRELKNASKNRGFASLSSYIQYLFKNEADLISETDLLKNAKLAQKEYLAGKSTKARSLADLV